MSTTGRKAPTTQIDPKEEPVAHIVILGAEKCVMKALGIAHPESS
jgi:hypothetical protein